MSSDSPFDDFTPAAHATLETVELTTDDGITISADVETPSSPRAVAALLHPHPLFGGRATTLCFSPSPMLFTTNASLLHAAISAMQAETPLRRCQMRSHAATNYRDVTRIALGIVGYSFGSIVAARIASVVGRDTSS